MSWRWPVQLQQGLPDGRTLTLRPLTRADRVQWESVRRRNAAWVRPWESTDPQAPTGRLTFPQMRRALDRGARDGLLLPFGFDAINFKFSPFIYCITKS